MSDSLVRVSRRVGWGARRPLRRSAPRGAPEARGYRPRRRRLPGAPRAPGLWPPARATTVHAPSRSADQQEPFRIRPVRVASPHPLPSRQFQALFDSLFKVLFIFPSRYLFAIGLVVVFSLWWSLPPTLGCTLKQPDSRGRAAPTCRAPVLRALHPLWARGNRIRSNLDVGVRKHGAKVTLP